MREQLIKEHNQSGSAAKSNENEGGEKQNLNIRAAIIHIMGDMV